MNQGGVAKRSMVAAVTRRLLAHLAWGAATGITIEVLAWVRNDVAGPVDFVISAGITSAGFVALFLVFDVAAAIRKRRESSWATILRGSWPHEAELVVQRPYLDTVRLCIDALHAVTGVEPKVAVQAGRLRADTKRTWADRGRRIEAFLSPLDGSSATRVVVRSRPRLRSELGPDRNPESVAAVLQRLTADPAARTADRDDAPGP